MSAKVNPSLVPRFTDVRGKANLVAALCSQTSISGNMNLAERIAKSGSLIEVKSKKTIIEQGGADNDVFFIISGSVGIMALLIFQWVVFTGAGISKPPAIQYAIAWKLAKFRYPRARRRASCSSPLTASIAADVV